MNGVSWTDENTAHLRSLLDGGMNCPIKLAEHFPGRTPRGIAWKLSQMGLFHRKAHREETTRSVTLVPGGPAEKAAMSGVDYRAGCRI